MRVFYYYRALMAFIHPEASPVIEAFRDAFLVCAFCLGVAAFLYALTRESHGTSRAGMRDSDDMADR